MRHVCQEENCWGSFFKLQKELENHSFSGSLLKLSECKISFPSFFAQCEKESDVKMKLYWQRPIRSENFSSGSESIDKLSTFDYQILVTLDRAKFLKKYFDKNFALADLDLKLSNNQLSSFFLKSKWW